MAPSAVMSAPVINLMPHVMDQDDIDAFVREYAASARLSLEGRADGVEVHLNHDDIHEWFLSPFTNQRNDRYGGSLENRTRFAVESLQAIRDEVGSALTVGVRLNIREEVPGGYDVAGGVEIAQYLESTGLIDYVHGVVGSPWGNPSYIQPTYFDPAQWAALAGELTAALSIPVVHTGRINGPDAAERVLAAGHADIVGMARAHIAEGRILQKAREGLVTEIRPCVGGNECISRRYVEGLGFACAVNPRTSHEVEGPWPAVSGPRSLLVIGGGPAGMELAALTRESGFDVTLWEAADDLGGQLRYAAMAPRHEMYAAYLDWQRRRLRDLGVDVKLGHRATADEVAARSADVVAVATGATPRVPQIPGADGPSVVDVREVLAGRASVGARVLVVAQDDHVAPLSVADLLVGPGPRGRPDLRHRRSGSAAGPLHRRRHPRPARRPGRADAVHGGGRRDPRLLGRGPQRLLAARGDRRRVRLGGPRLRLGLRLRALRRAQAAARPGPHPRGRLRAASPRLRHQAGLRPGRAARHRS